MDIPSERVLNLPLPDHLNHLLKLFTHFEMNLRLNKKRHEAWTTNMETLVEMIKSSFHRTFTETHFQQFLTVVPGFYLHKWEMRKGRLNLLVEFPADIASHVNNREQAQQARHAEDQEALHDILSVSQEVFEWR